MEKRNESSRNTENNSEDKTFWFAGIGIAVMFLAPLAFMLAFRGLAWGGPEDWETFASYFSGIVTPVVALGSVLLFLRSIIVQKRELLETRNEMKAANKIQLDIERTRLHQKQQEQLERAIPIVRKLHKGLFDNIKDWNGKGLAETEPGSVNSILKDFLQTYCEKSNHLISMLNGYLDAEGDIYLITDQVNLLAAERKVVEKFAETHALIGNPKFIHYKKSLNALLERRASEITSYEHRWS